QPYSQAGKRLGKEDDRHLWPEMLRAIREIQPTYVVGENVAGLLSWNGGVVFNEVQTDLEAEGYEVQPVLLPACAVNAPHRRDRIWFVAHSKNAILREEGKQRRGINGQKRDNIRSGHRTNGKNGPTPNANECTTGPSRTSGEADSNRSDNNAEQEGRRKQAELNTGRGDVLRDATNTNNFRRGGLQDKGEETGPQSSNELPRGECGISGIKGTTSNHKCKRSPGEEHREEESGQHTEKNPRNGWENFPTKSPIRSGDDGLSDRLDGITFPKWRNESIKAYGNAIVPQVAHQIFKAIGQTELF
ncbi:MAG: DNA (cytosine-5)-methyltransferase 1, partial [Bacteroidia bacterium]